MTRTVGWLDALPRCIAPARARRCRLVGGPRFRGERRFRVAAEDGHPVAFQDVATFRPAERRR